MFGGTFNGVVSALERTGEALSKSATQAAQSSRSNNAGTDEAKEGEKTETPKSGVVEETNNAQQVDSPNTARRKEMMGKIRIGWSSVMSATKNAIDHTRDVVEKEQSRIFAPRGPYRRDPKLPLDVDALRDAEVVYVTDRLITMSHPAMQSPVDGDITPDRKLAAVGHLLQRRHGGRYMVWNLSEAEYDVDVLDDQVLTYQFPGSPSPPLGLLLKLLISMESWLKADDRNVAVVHCLTGRGRTSTVVAAFLCWTGEAGFHDVNSALAYVAKCKHVSPEELTIPSQRRYVSYFANMLDGVRPSQPPLMLKRIVLSEAPKFAKGPPKEGATHLSPAGDGGVEEDVLQMGCAPYLQIFKGGQLVFTTAASVSYNQPKDELPFCTVGDGAISFHTESVVQGDILIRCRHLTKSGQRVSMFRAAFHTGYVPPGVLRLTKAQLDGACTDKRFTDDFYVDLIFEQCDAEVASKHLTEGEEEKETEEEKQKDDQKDGEAKADESAESKPPKNATVTASEYDSMLHRDSRFWDVISTRRKEQASKSVIDKENLSWGPTIGRRRAWDEDSGKKSKAKKGDKAGNGSASTQEAPVTKRPETFSIGEFDFLPDGMDGAAEQAEEKSAASPAPKERDELMEALMAIDNEALSPQAPKRMVEVETEEIVFTDDTQKNSASETKPRPASPPLDDKTSEVPASEKAVTAEVEETTSEKHPVKTGDVSADVLADADLDVDADVDAFLASAGGEEDGAEIPDASLDDLLDFDDEDADLEDLENFLTQSSK